MQVSNAVAEILYLIFDDILGDFKFPAMILPLATFYTFLLHRCCALKPCNRRAVRLTYICHMGFCGFLALFWLTIMALNLSTTVDVVQESWNTDTIRTTELKVHFAYEVFYFVASLDVVVWCAVLMVMSRRENRSKKVR